LLLLLLPVVLVQLVAAVHSNGQNWRQNAG